MVLRNPYKGMTKIRLHAMYRVNQMEGWLKNERIIVLLWKKTSERLKIK